MSNTLSSRGREIRKLIHDFIDQRLQTKIEKLSPDDKKYQAEQDKHVPETWLASAVERAAQIQVVTHPLKSTYPHAHIRETTSLYCRPDELPQHDYVSTQALTNGFLDDVTGNAAALDIYGLLQQSYGEQTLLQLCLAADVDFQAALHDETEIAQQWATAFAQVTEPKIEGVASHTNAKQLYWLANNDPYNDQDYVMLAPLHSSPLAQHVFEQINHDRFSEEAKEIRDAVRGNKVHDGVASHYPSLAIQVIGGSNPQGISSLTSRRRGVNYLLSSQPPNWKSSHLRPPLRVDSIFTVFSRQRQGTYSPHYWLKNLNDFLANNPPSNVNTRNRVSGLVNGLLDELYLFALDYQQLPSGWSTDTLCQLSLAQQCWLDPERALHDTEFADIWLNSDWPTQIEHDFSRWLNAQLTDKVAYLGDVEFRRWATEMRTDNQWAALISNKQKSMQKMVERRAQDVITT